MVIPEFNERGNLPPGIHNATWNEVVTRYGTSAHRRDLLEGLLDALRSLKSAGCSKAYLDGSFVTDKERPNDFDACWETRGVDPTRLDRELGDFSDARRAQKDRYGGELFPAEASTDSTGRTFLDSLQADRDTDEPKGIVALDLGELP